SKKSSIDLSDEPMPSSMQAVLSDRLYIAKQDLTSSVINQLMRLASFSNPDFYKTQAMRLSTYGKPRVISCAEDLPHYITVPRGCLPAVTELLEKHEVSLLLEDKRFIGVPVQVEFEGQLTTLQDVAARAILAHDIGI